MANILSVHGSYEEIYGTRIPIRGCKSVDESVHYSRYELAGSATSESIDFGPVGSVTEMYLKSDTAITYAINGGSFHSLEADGFVIQRGVTVTSLAVTEANGSDAVLEVYLGGT